MGSIMPTVLSFGKSRTRRALLRKDKYMSAILSGSCGAHWHASSTELAACL